MINFTQPGNEPTTHAIKFADAESGQEMLVKVFDKSPWMGDVHIEGRRYVEVSIEMFMALMQKIGWLPVQPVSHNESDPSLFDFKNADVDDDEAGIS